MQVAVIKYNAGNVYSVACALRRVGIEPIITDDKATIRSADKVIFPGVGEAATAMHHLRQRGLDELICSLTQPVLGICIGMQLLCRTSQEGEAQCLGIFDTDVKRFETNDPLFKIPHMGWNTLQEVREGSFLPASATEAYVYYVHSYYAPICAQTVAVTDYIQPYSAALQQDNFCATQFHPEKSGSVGELILKHFLER